MVYGNTEHRSHDGSKFISSGPPVLSSYLLHRYIHPGSFTVHRRVLDAISFDERMTTFEDVMFIGRVLRQFKVEHVDRVHAIWYRDKRPDQMTNRNYRRSYENWKRLCVEFRPELLADRELKRFYFRKMLMLSLMFFDVRQAIVSLKALGSKR